jgi:RNA polymerase sigma factor (sigma-70 family)
MRYSPELPDPSLFAAPTGAARPFEDILLDLLAATRAPLAALFQHHQIPPADAQDLLQESLLVLVERWHTVAHPPAFLYGIVHNRIRRHLDRQRTERALFTPLDHLEATATAADFVRHLESRAEARHLLARLPGPAAHVLTLRYAHGLSTRDTAAALHRSETAVRQTASRGLRHLRAHAGSSRP